MKRHLRLARIFAATSVAAKMEYRANFITNIVQALVQTIATVVGLGILFGNDQNVGGWSHNQAIVLIGVFTVVGSLVNLFIFPNLRRIAEAVRTGSMDFALLKPIDSQFLVSSREWNIFSIPEILIGLGLIAYGLVGIGNFSWYSLPLAALLLLAALAIVYSICFMLSTIAFWFVRVENTLELFWGFYQASQFPVSVYPAWVRMMFTFFIPMAFITTVPSEALIGKFNLSSSATALLVAAILLVVSRWFWRFALRSYTSASS